MEQGNQEVKSWDLKITKKKLWWNKLENTVGSLWHVPTFFRLKVNPVVSLKQHKSHI